MAKGKTIATVTEQKVEDAFNKIRVEIEKAQQSEPNVYQMMGLASVENHHSTFFGGLLNPEGSHALGLTVLKNFLLQLWRYQSKPDGLTKNIKSNEDILLKEFGSQKNYESFVKSINDAEVELEKQTEKPNPKTQKKGRMDIFVVIPKCDVVLVIENKYGTKSHDDQLVKYFEDVKERDNKKYDKFKKIFVYLSPFGDLPYNRGGDETYNKEYCVFDYTEDQGICKLINDLLQNKSKKRKIKITYFALEQYLDMCKKELLIGGYKTMDYKDIYKKYRKEYEKLKEFEESANNDELVIKHCVEHLGLVRDNSDNWFHSQKMKDVFTNIDGQIDTTVCRVVCQTDNENLVIYIDLARKNDKKWTEAQERILSAINESNSGVDVRFKPIDSQKKKLQGKFTLLNKSERNNRFETVKAKLENRLDDFKKLYLDNFEQILDTI